MSLLTRRRVSAGLAVVLSTGILAIGSHALAASAGTTSNPVKFGAETWYQPDPTCQLPTGCVSLGVTPPAVNPYGPGTLHVSVSAGEETSRTYLALPQIAVPAGFTLTSASFTAPLDTSNVASLDPDTSTLHVCSGTGTITADEGEFDSPPDTSCGTDVDLTYVATPTPEFTGDLAPLLNAHLSDLAAGKLDLAVLPLIGSQTAAWHDVFDSNDGTAAATTPTLNLTFTSADDSAPVIGVSSPSDSPSPTDSSTPAAAASAAVPVTSSRPLPVSSAAPVATTAPVAAAVPPTTVVPAPVAAVPSAVPTPQVAGSQAPAAQAPVGNTAPQQTVQTVASTRTVGFAYPAVLLLPLVLIAGGAGLARIMTRDVAPKGTRNQA